MCCLRFKLTAGGTALSQECWKSTYPAFLYVQSNTVENTVILLLSKAVLFPEKAEAQPTATVVVIYI